MARQLGHLTRRRWLVAGGGLGFTAVFAQVLLLRELLVCFRGNELSLGVSLAAWLLWVALGSAFGARLSQSRTSDAAPPAAAAAALALLLLGALPALSLWFARDLRDILGVPWGEFVPAARLVSATALLVAPVAFMGGMAFPLLCRAAQVRAALEPGRIYLAESVGFLLGGAASYAAADLVPPFAAAVATAAVGGIAATIVAWEANAARALTLAWTGAAAAALIMRLDARVETASLRNLYPGQRIVASRYSRYGSWAALAHAEQVTLYHNGALAFTIPQPMVAETLAHLSLLQHPNPRRALLLGGGIDGTAAEILKHPDLRLDYVELDPAVILIARQTRFAEIRSLLRHPRLRFHQADGRLFVKRASHRYDLIIVNLPEPATALLNRFYTVEFFVEARRALNRDGVLCLGLPAAENYIGPEMQALHGSVYHSLRRVFAEVVVTPGERSYFFASPRRGFLSASAQTLARRWSHRAVPTRYFGPYYIEAILLPQQVEFITRSCRSAPRAINRDFRPVGYFYDVAVAGLAEGLLPAGLVSRLRRAPVVLLAAIGVALLAVPLALSRGGQRLRRAALIGGIAAAGLAGMTLEVCLLFAFQVLNGHVYAQVGALIATFMGGLALGTWIESRALARNPAPRRRWLAWLLCGTAICAATPPTLTALAASAATAASVSAIAIAALMALGGAAVGALFPLAVHLLGGSAAAAGAVYAADLVGAALGACVAAAVALPLLGLAGTCYAGAFILGMMAGVSGLAICLRRL